jgi:ketosteroid isomerase-like protein
MSGGPEDGNAHFRAGIDGLLQFYAPDVVCYPAPGWVPDTVVRGHEGIRTLTEVWTANVEHAQLTIHEVRDMQQRLLILAELTGRRRDTRAPVNQRFAVINSDLRDDGKVGTARFFMDWQEAREAADQG